MNGVGVSDLQLLHAVRLRASATSSAVAHMTAMHTGEVDARLDALRLRGEICVDDVGAWVLTPAGVVRHAQMLFDELSYAQRRRLESAHAAFAPLDVLFVEGVLATEPPALGHPHRRGRHASRLASFGDIHERIVALLETIAGIAPRFTAYITRLARAERAMRDETDDAELAAREPYGDVWADLRLDLELTLSSAD